MYDKRGVESLNLSHTQKMKLVRKLQDDERRASEVVGTKKQVVSARKEDLVDVMSRHKTNVLYNSTRLSQNLENLTNQLSAREMIAAVDKEKIAKTQRMVTERLSQQNSAVFDKKSSYGGLFSP